MSLGSAMRGEGASRLMPFLWMRGEDEPTIREYMGVAQGSGCGAVCVESRPHPGFCGPLWWRDMDIVMDEARSRGMRVWVLDDARFPTGYANGALKVAAASLRRQSMFVNSIKLQGPPAKIKIPLAKLAKPPKLKLNSLTALLTWLAARKAERIDGDRIYSVTAFGPSGESIPIEGDSFSKPEGAWIIAVCGVTCNMGPHRDYINMMSKASCRLLIDAVYEPHFARYRSDFGKSFAGFFSDEPEFGNGEIYAFHRTLGNLQDIPWSGELEEVLGQSFKRKAPLLWGFGAPESRPQARLEYMRAATSLARDSFSLQIGDWCRDRGVDWIGHVIEDCNTDTCTGSGLGHFFRAEAGMSMAGVDCIGTQVMPGGEDGPSKGNLGFPRDGEFYHYALAKLAVSAAMLDERKAGRSLCEIFGNYGWCIDVSEMKYLADHFLVRGINHFVPHAFSPKAFPDPDCPPHFYAHGHNPQFRHISALFRYMGRVGELIKDIDAPVAILYHAEAEWMGDAMLSQKPARALLDAQIDFAFLPVDSLDQADGFKALVIPRSSHLPDEVKRVPDAIFIDNKPEGFTAGKIATLEELPKLIEGLGISSIICPADNRIRILRLKGAQRIMMLANEGGQCYKGALQLPAEPCFAYNAWDNRLEELEGFPNIEIWPGKSLIIIFGEPPLPLARPARAKGAKSSLGKLRRAICRSLEYPSFSQGKIVSAPDRVDLELPGFSGFIRYEGAIPFNAGEAALEVEALGGVEVFLNGASLGIQATQPCVYDLSGKLTERENQVAIEVATTLERELRRGIKGLLGKKPRGTGLEGAWLWLGNKLRD
jgi:hypothetical protein